MEPKPPGMPAIGPRADSGSTPRSPVSNAAAAAHHDTSCIALETEADVLIPPVVTLPSDPEDATAPFAAAEPKKTVVDEDVERVLRESSRQQFDLRAEMAKVQKDPVYHDELVASLTALVTDMQRHLRAGLLG